MADFVDSRHGWIKIPPGKSKVVRIGTRKCALFNVDGNIYAIADSCAHLERPWAQES